LFHKEEEKKNTAVVLKTPVYTVVSHIIPPGWTTLVVTPENRGFPNPSWNRFVSTIRSFKPHGYTNRVGIRPPRGPNYLSQPLPEKGKQPLKNWGKPRKFRGKPLYVPGKLSRPTNSLMGP